MDKYQAVDAGHTHLAEAGFKRRGNGRAPFGFNLSRDPGVVENSNVYQCSACGVVVHGFREICPCCYKKTMKEIA